MGHGPATFKEADMVRAITAARKAGLEIARVEVDKEGKIVVFAGKPAGDAANQANEWDEINGDDKIPVGQ